MPKMNVAVLALVFMLFVGISFAYSNLGGGWCGCISCADCSAALNDNGNCAIGAIGSGAALTTTAARCIDSAGIPNINGKIFDLNGSSLVHVGIGTSPQYGVFLNNTNNVNITNGTIIGWTRGIYSESGTNHKVDSMIIQNGFYGLDFNGGSGHTIFSNTIHSHTIAGIQFYDSSSTIQTNMVHTCALGVAIYGSNNVLDMLVTHSHYSGPAGYGLACDGSATGAQNNHFSNVYAYNNTQDGVLLWQCNHSSLTNVLSYNNSFLNGDGIKIESSEYVNVTNAITYDNSKGFDGSNSPDLMVTNIESYSNWENLKLIDTNRVNVTNAHLYNSIYLDLNRQSNNAGDLTYFTNISIDRSAGDYTHYSTFSIYDVSLSHSGFRINWSAVDAGAPLTSFMNKYVNILDTEIIDTVTWHWLQSEEAGYFSPQFEIWKFNGTWFQIPASLDLGARTLTVSNLDPHSGYGIFQNLTKCPIITAAGVYQLQADLSGAPNALPVLPSDADYACVVISSDDVVLDCNGYAIANDGTADAVGIYVNGTALTPYTNLTVENCSDLTEYTTAGLYGFYGDDMIIRNNTARNNTYGLKIYGVQNSLLDNNTVHNNTNGVHITNSGKVAITDIFAFDNSYAGFLDENSNVTYTDNLARDNWMGFATRYESNTNYFNSITYNNIFDFGVAGPASYNMTGCLFLNPAGTLVNYTNISVSDVLTGTKDAQTYTITWTANSTALPAGTRSFEEKFVAINSFGPSATSIDEVVWHWLASEEAGYDPSIFNLLKYNVSDGWTILNTTPDTVARTLSWYDFNPLSDYGIVEFVSNVTIVKTDLSVYPISQGGVVEFQLNITNEGNTTLNPVRVNDTLPIGFTYNNSNLTPDTILGQELIWNNVGPIAGGNSIIILVNATVDLITPSGIYRNTAEVEAQPSIGPNVTNTSFVDVTTNRSSVSINKTREGPTGVGSTNTFTIVINNTGEVDIDPYLVDTLPAQLTYNPGEAIPLPDTVDGQNLSWDAGGALPATLAPGVSVTIEYNATIIGAASAISNNATFTGVPTFNGANVTNNTFIVFSTWGSGTPSDGDDDLEISVEEPACLGDEVLITVTSDGDPLQNAQVTVRFFDGAMWKFIESLTDSNGETIFVPTHTVSHRASGQKSGYDYDEQYFDVIECEDECPPDQIYYEGECVDCIVDEDCEDGEVCTPENECVDCIVDEDCEDGMVCTPENECIPEEGCPEGQVWDADLGECVDCITYEDCEEGEICTPENECEECPEGMIPLGDDCVECITYEDCEDGLVCNPSNECEECPEGQVALGDDCVDCIVDEDCEGDLVCNPSNECVECETDVDCDEDCVCEDEVCVCECDELDIEVPEETDTGDEVTITVTGCDDPVSGAEVTVYIGENPVGGGITDENGQLIFVPTEPGEYVVIVNKEGFLGAEDEFVALSGETIWDLIIRGVWILLFILILIAIIYVLASKKKKRRAKDQEE